MPQRAADGRHLGGAGRDKKQADLTGLDAVARRVVFPGHRGGHFHGLAQGYNVAQQRGEADLDDAGDRRAGGGDQRPGQAAVAEHIAQGLGDNVRPARHLKHLVKAQRLERVEYLPHAVGAPVKLGEERRRGQGDAVLELKDAFKPIRDCHLGVVVAIADAGAAINAQLLDDMRPALAHADGLRGAVHQAVGTAAAQGFVQGDRVISGRHGASL